MEGRAQVVLSDSGANSRALLKRPLNRRLGPLAIGRARLGQVRWWEAEARVGDIERAVGSEDHAVAKGRQATAAVDQDVLLPVVPKPEEPA